MIEEKGKWYPGVQSFTTKDPMDKAIKKEEKKDKDTLQKRLDMDLLK